MSLFDFSKPLKYPLRYTLTTRTKKAGESVLICRGLGRVITRSSPRDTFRLWGKTWIMIGMSGVDGVYYYEEIPDGD